MIDKKKMMFCDIEYNNISEKEKDIQVYKNRFKTIRELFELDSVFHIIAGPCSVESSQQMEQTSKLLVRNGVKFLRGGAFKPRTSPYDFQGLGMEGLKILNDMRVKYGLKIVSEIMDPRDIEKALDYIDVIQIGSRNMANFSLLKEVGNTKSPVLLKRGMMSTYEEFIYASEYIVDAGNSKVIMCERGIRTFETITRNTIDIASVAMIKHKSSLPVVVDLSHSLGRKDILPPVLKCIMALNIDGIMLEVHPDPLNAKSDSYQQLNFREFEQILGIVKEMVLEKE